MGSQPGQKPRGKFMKHLQALSFPEVQPHAQALGHCFVPFIPFWVAGRQFFSGHKPGCCALLVERILQATASRRDDTLAPLGLSKGTWAFPTTCAAPETSPGTLPFVSFPSALHGNTSSTQQVPCCFWDFPQEIFLAWVVFLVPSSAQLPEAPVSRRHHSKACRLGKLALFHATKLPGPGW